MRPMTSHIRPPQTAPRTAASIVALVTLALGSVLPAPAHAQSPLEEVEQLIRVGRADEARTVLSEWWDGDRANASRRELQRGLWLRGRLTVDPAQAELDFQRLAVLYPSGQFTADAVLRLAQAAWAMGDEEAARRHLEALERDHPRSDALEQGRAWIADAGPVPPPVERQERTADQTTRRSGPTERGARAGREEARADVPMDYSVQLGAFSERERATALYDSIRARGVDVRIVRVDGSEFTHVRVGRFAERSAAVELMDELNGMGIDAALVRDDRREVPVGN